MEFVLFEQLSDSNLLSQVKKLIILGDREFIPPLSARSSTTQQNLTGIENGGIESYFEEMKAQSFVLAMEGKTVAGFMSFRKNHENPYITEKENLYASTCVVHPDFRGQGLMTLFYKTMITSYPERPIYTRTWHENFGHLKVLDRLGFICIKTVENDRGAGIHTVYYRKEATKLS